MQTITRKEIWRLGRIYVAAQKGAVALEDLRWVCESLPRAQWFEEMLHNTDASPASPTYGVINAA